MKKLSLEEIHKEEVNLLKKVIDYLDKNNITYYAFYGTLLGTIRHKGFIPWDDDIDLAIPRNEYNKLVNIILKNKDIDAIGFELGNSNWPFIKFIDKNIKVKEKENCDKYLWIDIFPLDGVHNKKEHKEMFKKSQFLQRLYFYKRCDKFKIEIDEPKKIKKLLKKIYVFLLRIVKYEYVIDKYIKYCKKNNDLECDYLVNYIWNDNENEIYNKDLFKSKKYKFEDIEINSIKDYDKILKLMYGDYMKLPKKEDRKSHSFEAWRINEK